MIKIINKVSREKVLRVAFSTFRVNLFILESSRWLLWYCWTDGWSWNLKSYWCLLKTKYQRLRYNWWHRICGSYCRKKSKNFNVHFLLSSFEKYAKELESDELEWGHLHTEKFWRENYKRFEENEFFYVK